MKFLLRITVLALAAVGARTLIEKVRPRVSGATGAGNVVSETLSPAIRGAASDVKQASVDAASDVKQASTQAVQDVVDATRQAAEEVVGSPAAAPVAPDRTTDPAAGAVAFGEAAPS